MKVIGIIKKLLFSIGLVGVLALATVILTACESRDADTSQGQTLQNITGRGGLNCGVSPGIAGFSNPNTAGEWEGLDVDFCRAVAAAVLGDATKVNFIPLSGKERFIALQSGGIDILSRNSTWTVTRDTSLGINFVGVTYYDGQGFMVRRTLGARSGLDLSGAAICLQTGTTTELNLADYFRQNELVYKPIVFDAPQQAVAGFESSRCDVLTSDHSQLTGLRTTLSAPDAVVILDDVISKEPLGPAVRQGDDQWFNIVKWVRYITIAAEENGMTSQNIDAMRSAVSSPEVKRILSIEGEIYKSLGLSEDWAYSVIKQVGNYGESFERTVGKLSPLNLSRGLNALWTNGGLMYAMPVR